MNRGNISSEEKFYESIGRAVSAFGQIEMFLCNHFALITQMPPYMAKAVFMSARSLRGRLDMIDATAVAAVSAPDYPSLIPFIKVVSKRTGQWSSLRNLLAHGNVVGVTCTDSKYCGQSILIDPGTNDWPNPKSAISHSQVIVAAKNFGIMNNLLLAAYNPPGGLTQTVLKECHELAQMLPTVAHEQVGNKLLLRLQRLVPDGTYQTRMP